MLIKMDKLFNKYNNTVLKIIFWTIAFWRKFKDMQKNNGDMMIQSSTYVSFESSATVEPRQHISNFYTLDMKKNFINLVIGQ